MNEWIAMNIKSVLMDSIEVDFDAERNFYGHFNTFLFILFWGFVAFNTNIFERIDRKNMSRRESEIC